MQFSKLLHTPSLKRISSSKFIPSITKVPDIPSAYFLPIATSLRLIIHVSTKTLTKEICFLVFSPSDLSVVSAVSPSI